MIFVDEGTLEVDEAATERRREEIRSTRGGERRTLEDLYSRSAGALLPSQSPSSVAGNREFGMD